MQIHFFQFLFSLLACCPTLNILLTNDVEDSWGNYEGVYTFQGFNDGKDFWVDTEGDIALWYRSAAYAWVISPISYIGNSGPIYSSSDHNMNCPNNEGYVWNWKFHNGQSYIATNDINIKCANENDFCTSENLCGTNQGDCDTHDECQDGHKCGSNNCPDSIGFHSDFDCCYAPPVGDEDFCTTDNPCAVDEGDCDSSNECQTNLICANNCPAYLGFMSDVNCCSDTYGCKFLTD